MVVENPAEGGEEIWVEDDEGGIAEEISNLKLKKKRNLQLAEDMSKFRKCRWHKEG